jgi:hypothetical protein
MLENNFVVSLLILFYIYLFEKKNRASDFVILGPITYPVLFVTRIQVEDVQATGDPRIYLGVDKDEMQIIAYYFN